MFYHFYICFIINVNFSELYRSSSFNSSGRSSICDTPDDVYSDTSIEEDVLDLNNKVRIYYNVITTIINHHYNIIHSLGNSRRVIIYTLLFSR